MKVTVKEKSETKEYPWIGVSEDKAIVLFGSPEGAICLKIGTKSNPIVDSEYWDINKYKPFDGEIVLSNS